jgi:hypothetical protein
LTDYGITELLISYHDEPPLLTKNNLLFAVKVNGSPPFKVIFPPPLLTVIESPVF